MVTPDDLEASRDMRRSGADVPAAAILPPSTTAPISPPRSASGIAAGLWVCAGARKFAV